MLHPDLADLQRRYTEVLDELDAGNLSYEDALSSVQAMTVIDGAGFLWSIDTQTGQFLRAEPGREFMVADFSAFQPAQTERAGQTWTSSELLQPPTPFQSQRPGLESTPFSPRQSVNQHQEQNSPQGLSQAFGTMRMSEHDYENQTGANPHQDRRAARPLSSSEKKGIAKILPAGPVGDFITSKARILAVAIGCVLILFAYNSTREPEEKAVSPGPELVGGTSQPVEKEDEDLLLVQPEEASPAEPSAPTLNTQREILSLLISADRAKVFLALATEPTEIDTILATALYAGYIQTGLNIKIAAPAAIENEDRAVSSLELVDSESGATIGQAAATWLKTESGWFLESYPVFSTGNVSVE